MRRRFWWWMTTRISSDQLTLLLKQEGYEVAAAGGTEEAEQVLADGASRTLAIVDLMMEHKDSGFVLCHEIKKLYPETPVIVLTGVKAETGISFAAPSPDEQSWVKADRVLDKPVRPEQLKNEIRRLLAARPSAAPHAGEVNAALGLLLLEREALLRAEQSRAKPT